MFRYVLENISSSFMFQVIFQIFILQYKWRCEGMKYTLFSRALETPGNNLRGFLVEVERNSFILPIWCTPVELEARWLHKGTSAIRFKLNEQQYGSPFMIDEIYVLFLDNHLRYCS